MFQLRYAASELRRRAGRTILTALGLAAGVGLVIGIIGVSQGLDDAQQHVLAPLKKVAKPPGVAPAAGGPPLPVQCERARVPTQVVNVQAGGETVAPAPLTDGERGERRQCLIETGAFQRRPDAETPPTTPPADGASGA